MTLKEEVLGRGKHAWTRITVTDEVGWVQVMGSYYPKEQSAYLWRKGDKTRGEALRNITLDELRTKVKEAAKLC